MHTSGCEDEAMTKRTCRHPAATSLGHICDYYHCECHKLQLWDEAAYKCVLPEDCSDQSKVVEEEDKLRKYHENMVYRPYVDIEYFE